MVATGDLSTALHYVLEVVVTSRNPPDRVLVAIWVWLKNGGPKWNPGKWTGRPKPAQPQLLNFAHPYFGHPPYSNPGHRTPIRGQTFAPTELNHRHQVERCFVTKFELSGLARPTRRG